ncbi:MAG: FtsW/RodA/SpoVE family cell cycle protein [Candidatus Sericytochromatia bacterium]|nr:FtsW/RodA/SpoVE family cell cycle protein [Candidatus Sericytochromatia bacterium]
MTAVPIDRRFAVTLAGLIVFGLAMVGSASAPLDSHRGAIVFASAARQAIYLVGGLGAMAFCVNLGRNLRIQRMAYVFHAVASLIVLLTASPLGVKTLGAQRWIDLGLMTFQPSELLKPSMVLFLAARSLAPHKAAAHWLITIVGIVFPLWWVVEVQSDLGTGLCIALGGSLTALMAGLPLSLFMVAALGGAAGLGSLAMVDGYRRERLLAYFAGTDPTTGPITQTGQALLAIGHGGLIGEGFGMGSQKFGHVAVAHTDFIFAIVAEEFGFIGGSAVICAFLYLGWRGLIWSQRLEDPFARAAMSGLVGGLVGQAMLNIGVAVTLLPVTGVPLPFVSLGGSGILGACITTGLFMGLGLRIERRKRPRTPHVPDLSR